MEPPVDGAHQRMPAQASASADGNDAHEHQHEQPVVVSPVENDVADAGHYSPDDYQRHGAEPVHQRPHDRPGYAALRPLHAEYDGGLSAVESQVVPEWDRRGWGRCYGRALRRGPKRQRLRPGPTNRSRSPSVFAQKEMQESKLKDCQLRGIPETDGSMCIPRRSPQVCGKP